MNLKLTPLGWMVGGRTRPEVEPVGDGENHTQAGTIMVVQGSPRMKKGVRSGKRDLDEVEMTDKNDLTGVVGFHKDCEEECRQKYKDLKDNMKRVWDLESEAEIQKLANTYYPAVRSQKQLEAEAQILRKLVQLPSGQYQTDLMWTGHHRPASNWKEARIAYLNWENRLEKDLRLKEAFHLAVKTWKEKDFIYKTTTNMKESDEQYFLTCFMVLKDEQPIEKARLVVNGARNFGGKCLNDYLEIGPNLMNDLSDILLLLRRQKWVVCCNMQNMFLNIKVSPKDRNFLRLFYRPHVEGDLEVYEFTVHIFGLASSPCVAMRVVREHASRQKERWTLAEEAVRTSSLVDDVWFAFSDPERLKKAIKQIVDLTGTMGIQVHKWGSNLEELIQDFS